MTTITGRFAPSPTGPLHAGSLLTAMASYLSVRSQHGRWLLRMEDVDQPRCRKAYAVTILRQLDALGFVWDDEIIWQSTRTPVYSEAMQTISSDLYVCHCSRRELQESGQTTHYPGTCRERSLSTKTAHSIRVKAPNTDLCFFDRRLGKHCLNLFAEGGDFIIRRADGYFSYQWAVVLDDAACGVTEVVRGEDLLESTYRQLVLQQYFGFKTPQYLHLPLVVDAHGQKLSKQQQARPVLTSQPLIPLQHALSQLGQTVNPDLDCVADFWRWAIQTWDESKIPTQSVVAL